MLLILYRSQKPHKQFKNKTKTLVKIKQSCRHHDKGRNNKSTEQNITSLNSKRKLKKKRHGDEVICLSRKNMKWERIYHNDTLVITITIKE